MRAFRQIKNSSEVLLLWNKPRSLCPLRELRRSVHIAALTHMRETLRVGSYVLTLSETSQESQDRKTPPKKGRSRKSKCADSESLSRGSGRYRKTASLLAEEAADTVAEAPAWRRLWPAAVKGVALALLAIVLVVFVRVFPATPPNHGKAGIVAGGGGAVSLPQQTEENAGPHLAGSAMGGSAMVGSTAAPIPVATETMAEPTPPPRRTQLTAARCSAMLRDRKHIFRRMWAADAWTKMRSGHPACWSVGRVTSVASLQTQESFFAELRAGKLCQNNWYEGNPGELGWANHMPDFGGRPAPALLGFDESIGDFCASRLGGWNSPGVRQLGNGEMCVRAGINILSLYGKRQPYNVCRNFEWQACRAEP